MLGYVVAYKPEMKVREAELYKAYYCGVCKSIGRRYGQIPRMVLSYDAAFLAVVLDSLYDDGEQLTREGCIANPFRKKAIASSAAIDLAADVMLILAWYKLADDIRDEGDRKAQAISGLMKSRFERLRSERPVLCGKIEDNLSGLTKLEDEKCASIDMAAEAFAKIMETIFVEGLKVVGAERSVETVYDDFEFDIEHPGANSRSVPVDGIDMEASEKILSRIGYHLGKWIYLMDAYDDIEENIRSGAYNPLLYRFGYDGEDAQVFRDRIKESTERNLVLYLSEIAKAFDLLDIRKNRGIIENIVYVGLLKKTEEVLRKGEKTNEQSV